MMTEEQVKTYLDDNLRQMRWLLQLHDWSINGRVMRLEGSETIADVEYKTAYRQAVIRVDPGKCHTEEQLLNALRHELIHLLLADYLTYKTTVNRLLTDEQARALEVVWQHAEERTVGNIERALDWGLRLTPAEMVKRFDSEAYHHGNGAVTPKPEAVAETVEA